MKKKIVLFISIFLFCITSVKAIPSDAVAEIDGTYYKSIGAALNAAPANTKTTITLVKDRTENITIGNTKNIVLDLNDYTLSNSGEKATVITNNGILEIKNGTVTTNASSGMINNNKNATLTITSGSYLATYSRQVLYNNGGTATISGTAYLEAATSERAAVHNLNSGNLTIAGGTIVASDSYAVYNEKGTLNIGTEDDVFVKTSPIIQGKTYGVIANYTFNFYDGTIKGGTYHVGTATTGSTPTIENDMGETKVVGIEEFSEKSIGEEEISGETYSTFTYDLDPSTIAKVTFDPTGGTVSPTSKKLIIGNSIGELPTPKKIDNTFDGWFTLSTGGDSITENTKPNSNVTYYAHWTYVDPNTVAYVEGVGLMSLANAFATGGNIRLEKDVVVPSSLVMDQAATLDLNGHTISLEDNYITINEDVTITDSSTNKNGLITSNADFTIEVSSTGSLTHTDGTIEGLGYYGAIRNTGTTEIDGGTLIGTSKMYVIYNENELTIKSGTVHSTNGTAIQNFENSTFVLDGGLLKTDGLNEQAVNLSAYSTATINGGTIEALNINGAGIGAFGNSTLVVNDGTIKGYDMAITGNGNDNNKNVSITINGGDITATNGVGMYLPQQDSTTIINGGNISGTSGIEIRAANLIVNGGNIVGTADQYEIKTNDSGTTSKGAAIAVSQHNTKKPIMVEINGGNLKGMSPIGEGNPQSNPQEAIDQVTITIKDGDFESTGDLVISAENPETIIQLVTGGTYNEDPSYYVQDGYGAAKIDENQYEVTKLYNIILDSSAEGIVSAGTDKFPYKGTLELSIKEHYIVTLEVTDSDGNKIEVKNNKFVMPEKDVTIKVIDKEIINPVTGDGVASYILLALLSVIGLLSTRIYKIKTKGI